MGQLRLGACDWTSLDNVGFRGDCRTKVWYTDGRPHDCRIPGGLRCIRRNIVCSDCVPAFGRRGFFRCRRGSSVRDQRDCRRCTRGCTCCGVDITLSLQTLCLAKSSVRHQCPATARRRARSRLRLEDTFWRRGANIDSSAVLIVAIEHLAKLDRVAPLATAMDVRVSQGIDAPAVFLLIKLLAFADLDHAR